MKISSVGLFSNKQVSNKQVNNKQINNNIQFKGYSVYPNNDSTSYWTDYNVVVDHKKTRVYDLNRQVYIADPEETIPPEVYQTHQKVVRSELYLNNIKDNCFNGYKNLANNAYREKNHFIWYQQDLAQKIEKEKSLKELIIEEKKESMLDIEDDLATIIAQKFDEKIEEQNNKINHYQDKLNFAQNQEKKAQRRYDLLLNLDEIGSKKQELLDTKSKLNFYLDGHKNKLEHLNEDIPRVESHKQFEENLALKENQNTYKKKILLKEESLSEFEEALENTRIKIEQEYQVNMKEFDDKLNALKIEYQTTEALIPPLQNELTGLANEFQIIDDRIRQSYKNVVRFYIENYPHLKGLG